MSYLEELLPEFRKGAKIRCKGWSKEKYIYIANYEAGVIRDEKGERVKLPFFFAIDMMWELYIEPKEEIVWDYIIKNKCLCAFWNKKDCEVLGFLKQRKAYNNGEFYMYFSLPGAMYKYCRPVRRDEVTFYEDKGND